jgi:hypothetical protein
MLTVARSSLWTAIQDETEVYDHVSQTEGFRRIDRAYRRVFNRLVRAYKQSYFRADPPHRINVLAGTPLYDLPDDFFQEIAVFSFVGGTYHPMQRFDPRNADMLLNAKGSSGHRLYYDIVGRQKTSALTSFKDQIVLMPEPSAAFQVVVEYVPHSASFESAGEVTYADPQGWTNAYVVSEVSAYVMRKRQRNPAPFIAERDEILGEIDALASSRTSGPGRVRDVTSRRLDPYHPDCDEDD